MTNSCASVDVTAWVAQVSGGLAGSVPLWKREGDIKMGISLKFGKKESVVGSFDQAQNNPGRPNLLFTYFGRG